MKTWKQIATFFLIGASIVLGMRAMEYFVPPPDQHVWIHVSNCELLEPELEMEEKDVQNYANWSGSGSKY